MGPRRHIVSMAAGALACLFAPSLSAADHSCSAPANVLRLAQPLTRTAARLARHEPLTIVAIGSSSTYGAGASSPANTYPSRLAVELKALFPKETITVINRGVNGEEVPDMLKRFADSVIKEKPDLVLWQVGTNSVLRDKPLGPTSPLLLEGIRRLKAIGADVVMIDPQYVPRVIAKADAEGMVRLIATTAKQGDVDLIQRFAMMRWWHDQEHMDFAEFASPDNLHMNDWGYACLAKQISVAITAAVTRKVESASARP
jgi:lysophospholipase L1-like esterase